MFITSTQYGCALLSCVMAGFALGVSVASFFIVDIDKKENKNYNELNKGKNHARKVPGFSNNLRRYF